MLILKIYKLADRVTVVRNEHAPIRNNDLQPRVPNDKARSREKIIITRYILSIHPHQFARYGGSSRWGSFSVQSLMG